jgi:hypothetical protein
MTINNFFISKPYDLTGHISMKLWIKYEITVRHPRYYQRMIAYKASKSTFLRDAPTIEYKIRSGVKEKLGIDIKVGSSEYESWKNSDWDIRFWR